MSKVINADGLTISLDSAVCISCEKNRRSGMVVMSLKSAEASERIRIVLEQQYILISDISVMTADGKTIGFETNGYAVQNDFTIFENRAVIDLDALEKDGEEITFSFRAVTFATSGECVSYLIKNILQQKSEIKRLNRLNARLQQQYDEVNIKYNDVVHSIYWRLMALPRRMVAFIKRHPVLFESARLLKGFLRRCLRLAKRILKPQRRTKIRFSISAKKRKEQEQTVFERDIKFSVLVPLYNTPADFLKQMIDSVRNQTYTNWELCLADGSEAEFRFVGEICNEYAQSDKRIKYRKLEKNLGISENTNACIDMATGDYIALFDHDDLLHPSALYEMMRAICEKNADFIYTDEVTFLGNKTSDIIVYHFKPDFAIDNLRANNYICHFSAFSAKLLESVGKFNPECDGSQDYDMVLRLTEKAENIVHIPQALYFWRSHQQSVASDISAKPYVIDAAKKALADHFERVGIEATVGQTRVPSIYKINYKIEGNPKISILIPNKDHIDDLDLCLNSIFDKSTYKNYEIIVIENNSAESATFDYYKKITALNENVKVVTWDGEFNYSAINNFGVRHATGEYCLFLNNDVEIITENWMEEMLMYAQRNDVGAVGVKLYYPDDTVQHGGIGIGLLTLAGHYHRGFERLHPGYMGRLSYAHNVSAVTAACMMVRRDVFEEIGGFEEKLKVAFNDVDLCMKIRQKGYLIVFTPFAELYHYESKSRGLDNNIEKRQRFISEVKLFHQKWDEFTASGDPYYNPNLTLDREDFGLK